MIVKFTRSAPMLIYESLRNKGLKFFFFFCKLRTQLLILPNLFVYNKITNNFNTLKSFQLITNL